MTTIPTQVLTSQLEPTQRGRGGAPRNNVNGIRHGLFGTGLPPGSGHIERRINQFRRVLEAHVIAQRGQVTIDDSLAIDEAFRWERHGQLASRWLYKHAAEMTHDERLKFSREAARAASERNKAVASLGLRGTEHDPWATLHHNAPAACTSDSEVTGVQVTSSSDNAGEGHTEAHDGEGGSHVV
jgi:hypothetical protein